MMDEAIERSRPDPGRRGAVARLAGALALLALMVPGWQSAAQVETAARSANEVPLEVAAADIRRLDKPIVMGVGERAVSYRETLVLTTTVDRKAMDGLPPSVEPFLYIGGREYRIFEVRRGREEGKLLLIFHIPDWKVLQDGAPMVLTIEHEAPLREPARFLRRDDVPRFDKSLITDSR
jgi:hypothetical protein